MLLVIALLAPTGAWAKRVVAGGSVAIAAVPGPLTDQVVATLITTNRGLAKNIVQNLPLAGPIYVAPFFVNEDKENPGQGDLFTVLILTNTTNAALSLSLTLRGLDGSVLAAEPVNLGPNETKLIELADLLP
jgi:hypothetical protein